MRIARLTPIALAALLAVSGAATARADDWEHRFAVGARPVVEMLTDDGRVHVSVGDGDAVVVRVHTAGWRIEDSGGIRITQAQDGDHVRVEVREPHFQFGLFVNRRVEIELIVPRELTLDVDTGDGSVYLPSLAGRVHVHTGDGSIVAEAARGELDLESGDGSIRGTRLQGSLRAHSGDGTVEVSGRFDRLALSSGDGSIRAEAVPGSKLAEPWDLHTGDGRIVLRVPKDLDADLDATTGDGSIDVDLPVTVSGRLGHHQLNGRMNAGGETLRLTSGDGSIHIAAI